MTVKQKIRDHNGNYIEVVTEEYALKSCTFTIGEITYLVTDTYNTGDGFKDAKHRIVWREKGEKKSAMVTHQYLIDAFLKQK